MDPRMNKGEYNFGERDGSARPNEAGVYYHPQADKFIESANVRKEDGTVTYHRATGKIQADAFAQIGYKPATAEQQRDYRAKQEEALKSNDKKEIYDLSKRGPGRPSNT